MDHLWGQWREVIAAQYGTWLRGLSLWLPKAMADEFTGALNRHDLSHAGRMLADWAASRQSGDPRGINDSGGIGRWWAEESARRQIEYAYGARGNLYVEDGKYQFPSWETNFYVGVIFRGSPRQFHGDVDTFWGKDEEVDVEAVEVYVYPNEKTSGGGSFLSLPVGRAYSTGHGSG